MSFSWTEVNNAEEMQKFYMSRLECIREAAKKCGYAIGLHGSTLRDFDLIAVPWIEDHSCINELAASIHMAACGLKMKEYKWEEKPSGRLATMFPVCFVNWYDGFSDGRGHIDLSVVGVKTCDQEISNLTPAEQLEIEQEDAK